jgi:hypothetical protein
LQVAPKDHPAAPFPTARASAAQDLLEDARQVGINEIRLQEKRVECSGGRTVLQTLLEEGAVVNASNRDGFTPLMIAARNGRADTLRVLLETPGVDLHAVNGHGNNAMHYAAMYAQKECVVILRMREREVRASGGNLPEKALYEQCNCLGKTPYDLAMVGPTRPYTRPTWHIFIANNLSDSRSLARLAAGSCLTLLFAHTASVEFL